MLISNVVLSAFWHFGTPVSSPEAIHSWPPVRCGIDWLSEGGAKLPHSAGFRLPIFQWIRQPYQQSAHMPVPCADGYGRPPSPQVDRRKVRLHLCTQRAESKVRTRGAGTRDAAVELGGQGPLASSPRFDLSPSPRFPSPLSPQHLRVASSCGKKQPRITIWSSLPRWGDSFTQGLQAEC